MNGFFLINKEENQTSYDVIRQLKRKHGQQKFGHTGTLDPLAEGLLVIGVNKGTKLFPLLTENSKKKYIANVKLGIKTDTADITGKVIEERPVPFFDEKTLQKCLDSFLGETDQTPPIYSAKKVNGKKLYEYARKNKEVEIKKQTINLSEINLINIIDEKCFQFEVTVSKGTYIRTLIEDIANKLGTVGTMTKLVRTETDGFKLTDGKKISELSENDFLDLGSLLKEKFTQVEVYDKVKTYVQNGVSFKPLPNYDYPIVYVDQDTKEVVAIYQKISPEKTKPVIIMEKNGTD